MNDTPTSRTLHRWLSAQAPAEGLRWLEEKLTSYETAPKDRSFYLAFGAVPRYLGKAPLNLAAEEQREVSRQYPGLRTDEWTVDQTARTWLLLHLPAAPADAYVERIEKLFLTADMGEQIALYRFLAFAKYPERFHLRTAEGIRTNITSVFDAIALDNPYPAAHLPEGAWNQMVLKAAFMDRPLWRIHGLRRRANARLAVIISDYAHERWAAGRVVSPELWRPVGPFLDQRLLADVQKLFGQEAPIQQKAAALICADSDHPDAARLLAEHPALKAAVESGELNWDSLGREWQRMKEEQKNSEW